MDTVLQFVTKLSFVSSLFSSLGACTFRTMILHQRPLRTIYDTLSLTNSTLSTADTILWCTKKNLFLIDDCRFLFHRKNIIPCTYSAPFVPPNLLHTTTKSDLYLVNFLAAAVSEPDLYKFYQIPYTFPIV